MQVTSSFCSSLSWCCQRSSYLGALTLLLRRAANARPARSECRHWSNAGHTSGTLTRRRYSKFFWTWKANSRSLLCERLRGLEARLLVLCAIGTLGRTLFWRGRAVLSLNRSNAKIAFKMVHHVTYALSIKRMAPMRSTGKQINEEFSAAGRIE